MSSRVDNRSENHYLAGLKHLAADEPDLARHDFAQAVQLDPLNANAHARLGEVLLELGQNAQATWHRDRAFELAPDDVDIAVGHATFLERNHRRDEAESIVKRLLDSGNASARLIKAYLPIARRNHAERQALELIDRILSNDASSAIEKSSLHLSTANLLDGLGRYDDAFVHARIGNALRDAQYDFAKVERVVAEWTRYFTRPTFRRLPHATHGSEVPVFVLGMPRSGTTLVEQILASHPAVYGAGELRWIHIAHTKRIASASTGEQCFDGLSISDVDEMAEQYLQPLMALSPNATRIINKLPGNLFYLGLIQLLFPMSKVIYCRREPLDTCISCFFTDFDKGNNFSFSLESVGHYARHNQLMMSHWKSALSLPILEVQYERMVASVESETHRLLDFLDLPWDDNCLRFYENRRYVATSSHTQVRRPIYQNSVGRWRNYERHLDPLKAALNSPGTSTPYAAPNHGSYSFATL